MSSYLRSAVHMQSKDNGLSIFLLVCTAHAINVGQDKGSYFKTEDILCPMYFLHVKYKIVNVKVKEFHIQHSWFPINIQATATQSKANCYERPIETNTTYFQDRLLLKYLYSELQPDLFREVSLSSMGPIPSKCAQDCRLQVQHLQFFR